MAFELPLLHGMPKMAATSDPETGVRTVPLCVDLDGTPLRTDTLREGLVRLAQRRPLDLLRVPRWLAEGRAVLKREVAARAVLFATRDRLTHLAAAGAVILVLATKAPVAIPGIQP